MNGTKKDHKDICDTHSKRERERERQRPKKKMFGRTYLIGGIWTVQVLDDLPLNTIQAGKCSELDLNQ